MKKILTILTVVVIFVCFLIWGRKVSQNNITATYYTNESVGYTDTLNYRVDFQLDIDPRTILSVNLTELILYPSCQMDSPDGSNSELIEEKINLKKYRQEMIRKNKSIIIRVYDKVDVNETGNLYPGNQVSCPTFYSGKMQLLDKNGDTEIKYFTITSKEFTPVIITSSKMY